MKFLDNMFGEKKQLDGYVRYINRNYNGNEGDPIVCKSSEMEDVLGTLLYHSMEIGKLLKRFGRTELEVTTNWIVYVPSSHIKHPIIVSIGRDTIDKMKSELRTGQSTFNEINVRLQKKFDVTYEKNDYRSVYYQG